MSYIGAAANIVGGEMQGWANVLDKQNMYRAFQDQQNTQRGFQQQGQGELNTRLAGAGADVANKQIAQGTQNREQDYAKVNATPLSVEAPKLPQLQQQRNMAEAAMFGQQRAKLGGYGDWLQQQWLANNQFNQDFGKTQNFAQGAAKVFPFQMYKAQHSWDDLAAIGAAISSIGGGAANYAAIYGGSPGGGTNLTQSGNGTVTDPYGVQYNLNSQGQMYNNPSGFEGEA